MHTSHANSQNGQSLIIIALMIVGIFGFLGLVLDGGQVFLTRRNSQDAADAAAFASVRVLAVRPDNSAATEQAIYNAALDYARVNQVITNTDVTVAFINQTGGQIRTIDPSNFVGVPTSPLATGVRVTATIRLQPYFIDLLIGNNPVPIQSVAAAQSGPPSIGSDLKPMGLYCSDPNDPNCQFQFGTVVRLFGGVIANGGFQWLDFNQTNSTTGACTILDYLWLWCDSGAVLADKLDTYYNPSIPKAWNLLPPAPPVPSPWVQQNTGNQLSTINDPLDCWLNPTLSYHSRTRNCWQERYQGPRPSNRLWTIPVFNHDNNNSGGVEYFHTVRFAEFEFQAYYFGSNQCNWANSGSNGPYVCDPTLVPAAYQSLFQWCETNREKCIIGTFRRDVQNLQIKPGVCNSNPLDTCGFGLSQ